MWLQEFWPSDINVLHQTILWGQNGAHSIKAHHAGKKNSFLPFKKDKNDALPMHSAVSADHYQRIRICSKDGDVMLGS